MLKYSIYVLVAILIISADADRKKPSRSRRPKNEDDSTPQPNVVSYSTFGFNDVSSYDGFVPTSPDYASFLSNNPEATTRLYAPAFPSAPDSTDFNGNYGSLDGFNNNEDNGPQSSMLQYPQNSMNFFQTPSFENNDVQSKNIPSKEVTMQNSNSNGPVYGTKLGSKNKKGLNPYNNTAFEVYSSGTVFNSNDGPSYNIQEMQSAQDIKANFGESEHSDQNNPKYVPNYPLPDVDEFVRAPTNTHNTLKFPRVVDFTKIKEFYPTELDNKYQVATYSSIINTQNENVFANSNENQVNNFMQPTHKDPTHTSPFDVKPVEENSENENTKTTFPNSDYFSNYIKSPSKNSSKVSNSNYDIKDNYKHKWSSENDANEFKNNRNPYKGYEYSTNYSNTSFKYEYTPDKKPFNANNDELVPASSNIDLTTYSFPDSDYSRFKKIPTGKFSFDNDYDSLLTRDKFKSEEYLNQFKNLYSNSPSNSANQWGYHFKNSEYPYKHRSKKPQYDDNGNNDVVHIPKRPNYNKYNYEKNSESKLNDYTKHRPYKSTKYEKPSDWTKEIINTRFKSEEDLLGLRTHDTSHPSYLPSNRPSNNDLLEESDYRKLVDKWRQSYLKSKYKEAHRDHEFESYASEAKPLHVPIPKPYPIEVPHPVIVPVPQPYPVRVPVPKPVAVPVVRELTVPIEKPVPYPVIKKVPYPVEKPVPVPVEKEVPVPVMKPYPVHIPHIRPVFHHSRPPREEFDSDVDTDDDDYFPRPENKKKILPYKKRPKTTRIRPRRPTRTTYRHHHDRTTSRRSPTGYRSSEVRARRPSSKEYHSPYRYSDFESKREYDSESIDYYRYCKRTGNC